MGGIANVGKGLVSGGLVSGGEVAGVVLGRRVDCEMLLDVEVVACFKVLLAVVVLIKFWLLMDEVVEVESRNIRVIDKIINSIERSRRVKKKRLFRIGKEFGSLSNLEFISIDKV